MKTITKEIQTVTEQVEVKEGVFYFNIDYNYYKVVISFIDDAIYYKLEILTDFYEELGIKVESNYALFGDDLPYEVKLFILEDKSVKTITEEWYTTVRNEILKRL